MYIYIYIYIEREREGERERERERERETLLVDTTPRPGRCPAACSRPRSSSL